MMTALLIVAGIYEVCLPICIYEIRHAIEIPQDMDIYDM